MIAVNLFIYEAERKCNTQKRSGEEKHPICWHKDERVATIALALLPSALLETGTWIFQGHKKLPYQKGKKVRMEGEI